MRYLAVIFAILSALDCAQAACPNGSNCQQFNGQYDYLVNGGTTARKDYNRWIDNFLEAPDAGVDCTGTNDSTDALQTAINAMADGATIKFPAGCTAKLGTGTSSGCALTVQDRLGLQFTSDTLQFNGGTTPKLLWNGTGGKMWCVNGTDHPRFIGLYFVVNSGKSLDSFIVFDGEPVTHTPTAAYLAWNIFDAFSQNNASFIALSIAPTAGNNHENYMIEHNTILCSGGSATLRSVAASTTNGSPNLTGATGANFVAGDVGKRIRVSYAGGILDTTISSITSGTAVVMAANATFTQSNVTVHTAGALGIGIDNGPSANAKHQRIYNNVISNCAIGVKLENGSVDIDWLGGGANDITAQLATITSTEPIRVAHVVTENDMRQAELGGGTFRYELNRYAVNKARADGFVSFGGSTIVTVENNKIDDLLPSSNAVLYGTASGGNGPTVISIGNNYFPTNPGISFATAGYTPWLTSQAPMISLNDTFDSFVTTSIIGGKISFPGLPTSCSGLATGTLRNNSGVVNVCP